MACTRFKFRKWKREFLDNIPAVFGKEKVTIDWSKERDDTIPQIGEVTVERDWLKKKLRGLI